MRCSTQIGLFCDSGLFPGFGSGGLGQLLTRDCLRRSHEFLKRVDDCGPCWSCGVGDREVAAVDLEQLCVLGGGHVGHPLRERDPVVGLGVHAAYGGRDGHLGQGVGDCVPVGVLAGSTAYEFVAAPFPIS